jgi:hypothetical protein
LKTFYERSKMRFDKGALNEARKNANEGRPDWMSDELWNDLSDERRKEVVEKEARVQQEMETVRNQAEQKAKFTPGSAPTADNLKDFFDFIDRTGQQARQTGQDIGVVANKETAKAIEAQRAAAKEAKDAESIAAGKKLEGEFRTAAQLAGTETWSREGLRVRDELVAKGIDIGKIDPNAPGEDVTAAVQAGTKRAQQERMDIEDESQRRTAANAKFIKRTGTTGTVTLSSGEQVDVDDLLTRASQPGNLADKDLRRDVGLVAAMLRDQAAERAAADKEAKRDIAVQRNTANMLRNAASTAMQNAIRADPSNAFKFQTQQAQQQAFQNYTGGTSQPGAQPAPAPTPAAPTPTAAPSPSVAPAAAPSTPTPTPAPTSSTGTPLSPRGSPSPSVTQPQPQQTGQFAPTASAVGSVADQKKLLASLLQPQKPTRMSAKKATATVGSKGQVSVVAEEVKVRFEKYDLQDLLEAAGKKVSPKDLVNIGKKVKEVVKKAPAFAKAASRFDPAAVNKILDAIKIANPYEFKAPQDRVVYTPAQTGYSHKKAVRTVKQLMKNPVINAIPGPETLLNYGGAALQLGGRALMKGMPKIAGLGKFGQEIGRRIQNLGISLDTPEAKAAKAIAIGAIIGDPRTAQVQVGEVMDGEEVDDRIKLPRKSKSSPGSSSGTP